MKKIFFLLLMISSSIICFSCDGTLNEKPLINPYDMGGINYRIVAKPQFNPSEGIYCEKQDVEITCSTDGSTIYYTTDGSEPTILSSVYLLTISVSGNGTVMNIKAIAVKEAMGDSDLATAEYTINWDQVSTPNFDPPAGTYPTAQTVTISTTPVDATIKYTTDGSDPIIDPNGTAQVHTAPVDVNVDTSMTIKAYAYKTDWDDSDIGEANYTLNYGTVATPTFSPPAGTYPTAQTVTISTTTAGATIKYTIDGSDPISDPNGTAQVHTAPVDVNVSVTTTIKAYAYKTDWTASTVATAIYTLKVVTPTYDPVEGYITAQNVTISTTTAEDAILYTTDGTSPTHDGSGNPTGVTLLYSGPVSVTETQTVSAIGYKTDWDDSDISEATYTIYTLTIVDFAFNVGTYSSIALDTADNVHIGYHSELGSNVLKYATNKSGDWVYATPDSAGELGFYTSIALDNSDNVHISYQRDDAQDRYLKYATDKSGSWVPETIDFTVDIEVGYHTSIALDNADKVHISYEDSNSHDLKYATNNIIPGSGNCGANNWQCDTLDSTGSVGKSTSIALDNADKVHISYYDEADLNLKYATNKYGAWSYLSLDFTGSVGKYTSIALDNADKVHISYYDETNSDLKYATNNIIPGSGNCGDNNWQCDTLDSTGSVGEYTSIALDTSDNVHISYRDGTNADLKYATNKSGSWVYVTLDFNFYGYNTSIALDTADNVYISYCDMATNEVLKYVWIDY